MRVNTTILAFSYLRLSNEEAQGGESSSITNQRMIVQSYCKQHGITLLGEFVDDGYSGGNFDRPGFQHMIAQLEKGRVNTVLTKDLSRLGRDMREASYYAEQYFPEHGIRYIAITDNFDTEQENVMAPFQFAMNEVYLRDGSRKVKDVLRNKRQNGQYCACPPYGYRKNPADKTRLIPDEITAPIVQRIFEQAAGGASSRKIALDLNESGVIPPLKYRVLYRDEFSDSGAARASDYWNYTTVKRILKNPVYLGHTLLGKSRKASIKSKKKIAVPKEQWCITEHTHPALITEDIFDRAQINLGRGTKKYEGFDQVRKSIFSGVAFCGLCGHALCSSGTVYKGEREKYWYLSCTHTRKGLASPCEGVRIRYQDLVQIVLTELNHLLSLSDQQISQLVEDIIAREGNEEQHQCRERQREKAEIRLATIDKIITKLYTDNAEGKLDDERLYRMVTELEAESTGLRSMVEQLRKPTMAEERQQQFEHFFSLTRSYTQLDTLTRETLLTFIKRIEVGRKELPEGVKRITHSNQNYRQQIKISYKFIGELATE